jgi:Rrf2 family iron-sulfur cluster assembly transcriptional regulator
LVQQDNEMYFPRRSILALSVMIDIAQNAATQPVSAKDLAERHGVLPRFFEIMLKDLAASGLIRGQRGPKGGYQLSREAQDIAVPEIIAAVSGDGKEDLPIPQTVQGKLMPYLDEMNAFLNNKLRETSLAALMRRTDNKNLASRALAG